jgi:hypothetical protein
MEPRRAAQPASPPAGLRRVADIDFRPLLDRPFHPSPVAWEDEVLYFLLLDRFSDGRERDYLDVAGNRVADGETPPLGPDDRGNAVTTEQDAARWRAGAKWCGGTLNGLRSKLGYLRRLGVTGLLERHLLQDRADPHDPAQEGQTVRVERRNGRAVRLTVPAAGFVVFG